ncbi:SCAN domain-containing protein 3-like [Metopolophium dirhodum]|uniref:SCAN domain-containing protein 3-like n=1 Tax=Metopolophium dirhodum TaxID=44670 RepID=UPI00298F7F77|nr:SCAN domain-containing protein 3-like [Metopolophium dirhodum]
MHPEHQNKTSDFFERKASEQSRQVVFFDKHTNLNKTLLKASFEMALLIAKAKKSFTIGENLVLPAAIKICEIVHGDKIADALRSIPVSNDTIKRRIDYMGDYMKSQLLIQIKNSDTFAIQLDESTDLTNNAQLMVFVRYQYNLEINEDLLFCETLSETTKGIDIFKKVNDFFIINELDWTKCVGVCTDGAAAMTGRISGFKAEVMKVSPDIRFVHCIIHREHLTFRKIGCELNSIMNDVVSMVNFVKTRALNSRLFKILCEDMGSNHNTLLFHTDVRWLSRGKVLKRVIELSDEFRIFLRDIKPDLSALLSNEKWMCLTSYLADFFDKVNELNLSLQEQLIEIREDSTLETEFNEKELTEFWLRRQQEYPVISKAALLILIPFASTYLCETAFSQLQIIKNKHRSCISQQSLESNLRISVSNITPDINMLCENMQAQPSH